MTNSSNRNWIEFIKEMSGVSFIVALCYYFGYVTWTVYNRVLGIEVEGQAIDYLKTGGDFVITTTVDSIRLIASEPLSMINSCFQNEWFWVSIFLIFSLIIYSIIYYFFNNCQKLYYISYCSLIVGTFFLLKIQVALFSLDKLLQIDPHRIYMKYNDTDVPFCERNQAIYSIYINDLKKENIQKHELIEKYFSMVSIEDNANKRLKSYILIVLFTFFSLIGAYQFWKKQQFSLWLFLPVIFCFLVLPVSYGVLGKNFRFPYVTFKLEKKGKQIETHCIYLLKQNSDSYLIYDPYNFFKIKTLPKGDVKEITQFFKVSPFDSRIPNQSSICDSLTLIPQNQKIIDF